MSKKNDFSNNSSKKNLEKDLFNNQNQDNYKLGIDMKSIQKQYPSTLEQVKHSLAGSSNQNKLAIDMKSIQKQYPSILEQVKHSLAGSSNQNKLVLDIKSIQKQYPSTLEQVKHSLAGNSNQNKLAIDMKSMQKQYPSILEQVKHSLAGSSNQNKLAIDIKSIQKQYPSILEQVKHSLVGSSNQNKNKLFNDIKFIQKQYPFATEQFKNSLADNSNQKDIYKQKKTFENIREANLSFSNHLSKLTRDYQYERKNDNDNEQVSAPNFFIRTNEKLVPMEELERGFGLLDLLKKVSEAEMVSFVSHLMQYPMLALEHKVGKLIRSTIKNLAKVKHVSSDFYRCRVRPEGVMMPWTAMEMWEAPLGISSQGRFNIEGNGFLYVSSAEEVSLLEMKQPSGTLMDVMKVNFNANINLIDITDSKLELFRYCMFKVAENTKIKKEYLIPNFLSQCCQIENIHAIKYKSVFDVDTNNYVFFDYLKEWFTYESCASVRISSD